MRNILNALEIDECNTGDSWGPVHTYVALALALKILPLAKVLLYDFHVGLRIDQTILWRWACCCLLYKEGMTHGGRELNIMFAVFYKSVRFKMFRCIIYISVSTDIYVRPYIHLIYMHKL